MDYLEATHSKWRRQESVWLADLHWSHKSHIKPEGQAVHQAWVHHVELKGDLYPGTQKKRKKC